MVILGLGCNVGDRLSNLRQAFAHLQQLPDLTLMQVSPVYESDPLLPDKAPHDWDLPYLNLAISYQTKLSPQELLVKLKEIEAIMGRAVHLTWSPRIIDIDILAWDALVLHEDNLIIPHPDLIERPFALFPLADIAPDWRYCVPGSYNTGKPVYEIIKKWGSRFTREAPLHTRQIAHRIDTPEIVGILNITKDSFSDGGEYYAVEKALLQAQYLFANGADIIDIGAESTRPGAQPIDRKIEEQRLSLVLSEICSYWQKSTFKPKISIDSKNLETIQKITAHYCIDWVNDVSGLTNPDIGQIVAEKQLKAVFMHNLGIPLQANVVLSSKKDLVKQVYDWAEKQLKALIKLGLRKEQLIFDVGIGFGKTADQSYLLLKEINRFSDLGLPILVGHSRKSFLTRYTDYPAAERDIETAAVSSYLAQQKVDYLRVHNVAHTMRALRVLKSFTC